MRLGIHLVLLLWGSLAMLAQGEGRCVSATFLNTMKNGSSFAQEIGSDSELRLTSSKNLLGWIIAVTPKKNPDKDWTFPVNFPLRTGERQFLATGYGETVEEKLGYAHEIRFVLSKSDYERFSRLASATLESSDADAATKYIAESRKMPTGTVLITPLNFETTADGRNIKWAKLKFVVTVPERFSVSSRLEWHPSRCPSAK